VTPKEHDATNATLRAELDTANANIAASMRRLEAKLEEEKKQQAMVGEQRRV
jgi:hypothetical protein